MSLTKVTSNVIASGVIPAEYDDANVRSDILKLALHQAVDGNRVAYNLENSFVDGFEDDTGITTETNVDRDTTGEYVSSIYTALTDSNITLDSSNYSTYVKTRANGGIVTRIDDFDYSGGSASDEIGLIGDTYNDADIWGTESATGIWGLDINGSQENAVVIVFKDNVTFKPNGNQIATWKDGAFNMSNFRLVGVNSSYAGTTLVTWGTPSIGTTFNQSVSQSTFFPALSVTWTSGGSNDSKFNNLSCVGTVRSEALSNNATGTLISDAQTASSSRTSCSGVIIYSDASGTATLGTDLKIYFTCNNGANWTEANSYGTATTYSGTKKLVKLGATTCTAGTQVAMKAVWANQASGSKETRLEGWAVNY